MSTRGVVGIGISPERWEGVYNHYDSYPHGLGQDVWDMLAAEGGVSQFISAVVGNPQGFRAFPNNPFEGTEDMTMTPETADWLFIEWGYILNPDTLELYILEGYVPTGRVETIPMPDGRTYERTVYTYRLVTTLLLGDPQPDWSLLPEG